jgi:hypothetical protein
MTIIHYSSNTIPNREPMGWDETAPGIYETEATDGSLWRHSARSRETVEITDMHAKDSEMASNMHNYALDHMDVIDN